MRKSARYVDADLVDQSELLRRDGADPVRFQLIGVQIQVVSINQITILLTLSSENHVAAIGARRGAAQKQPPRRPSELVGGSIPCQFCKRF